MFKVSDETYKDNIKCSSYHYNAMKAKPTYPPALIENNVSSVKPFPNNWLNTRDEWKYFRDERKFAKRCLFRYEPTSDDKVHLRSVDSLTNKHLLGDIKFPHEDYIYQVLGSKRAVPDKRNSLAQRSPGDKSYKTVEYSNNFFGRRARDWRSEKYRLPGKQEQTITDDIIRMLDLDPNGDLAAKFFSRAHHSRDNEYDELDDDELANEIESIQKLDTWRPATPLKLPFKVLDLSDKSLKYRPKVTR